MCKSKPLAIPRCGLHILILSLLIAVSSVSCVNEEGLGGTGAISGTIIEHFYNDDFSSLIYTDASVDEEVFILFGEDREVGDRVRTGITGQFRFNFLYPGTYYIYYSSGDSTTVLDDGWSESVRVELGNGEERDLGELVKLSTLDYDDGKAVIMGKVRKIKYTNGSWWPNLVVEYIDNAYEQEVYLTYGDHEFYDERIRTQHDGSFQFRNLIPGDYLVFLYSEDVTREKKFVVLKYPVSVTEFDQVVDLGEITVEEL
jgi:hypothetical protein